MSTFPKLFSLLQSDSADLALVCLLLTEKTNKGTHQREYDKIQERLSRLLTAFKNGVTPEWLSGINARIKERIEKGRYVPDTSKPCIEDLLAELVRPVPQDDELRELNKKALRFNSFIMHLESIIRDEIEEATWPLYALLNARIE